MRKVALLLLLTLFNCSKTPQTNCNFSVTVVERMSEQDPFLGYTDIVLYAFNADTLTYHVSSYDEARSGKITNYNTQLQKSYDIEAVKKDTSYIVENITFSSLVMVLCDTVNKIYAYKQNEVAAGLDSVFLELEIEPIKLQEGSTLIKNGWRIRR